MLKVKYQIYTLLFISSHVVSCSNHINNKIEFNPSLIDDLNDTMYVDLELPWIEMYYEMFDFIEISKSFHNCGCLKITQGSNVFPKHHVSLFLDSISSFVLDSLEHISNFSSIEYEITKYHEFIFDKTIVLDSSQMDTSCEAHVQYFAESKNKEFIYTYLHIPKLFKVYWIIYAKTAEKKWSFLMFGARNETFFFRQTDAQ